MSWRDISNAIKGFNDLERARAIREFEISRFNAFSTAFSDGSKKAIKATKNPYTKSIKKSNKPLTMSEVASKMPRAK